VQYSLCEQFVEEEIGEESYRHHVRKVALMVMIGLGRRSGNQRILGTALRIEHSFHPKIGRHKLKVQTPKDLTMNHY
jgi:hypothetical protein